jgi:hypothetical protein
MTYDEPVTKPDRRWWQHKDTKRAHEGLWRAYEHARASDVDRPEQYRALRNYYSDGVQQYKVRGSADSGDINVSRHNLLASVCDTAATKVLDHRPDPEVLTSGGSTKEQKQAKDLSRWTAAASTSARLAHVVEEAGREAILNGTGAFRIFERYGRPATEIVYCDHVFVDPLEAWNQAVMTYYWERLVDREVLLGMFPSSKQHIMGAKGVATAAASSGQPDPLTGTSDMVLVVQAWRIAVSDDPADAGRFAIATESGILHSEAYESEDAPFVFLRWRYRPRHHFGIGIGHMLAGIQEQIDRHTETVDRSLDAMTPSYWVQGDSVVTEQIDDGIARVYKYNGNTPPVLFAPGSQAVQGHTQREQYLTELVYQLSGVSSMEAGAQKPAGLNSGVAQRVHQDIKSDRLREQVQQVRDAYEEAYRRIILVADQIVEGKRDRDHKGKSRLRYLAGAGKALDELDYSDVRIRDTLYRVQVFPISKLPQSPSGRREAVQDMINSQMIPPDLGLKLLDMPDIDAFLAERTSRRDHAHFLVDKALAGRDAAKWLTADDDVAEVVRYGQQMRAKVMLSVDTEDPDEAFEQVEVLRELLGVAIAYQTQAAEAMAPPPASPAAPPAGPPGMPPMPAPPMPLPGQ